jgi:4-hydroxybenzoate polyprenyltransferase
MKAYLSLIRFAHTIFALPFAFLSFFLATRMSGHVVDWLLFLKIALCMVFARSAAMAFNRYVDRHIDERNVRTSMREIPSGLIRPQQALLFTMAMSVAFILTTLWINSLVFTLSPVALLVILGYSYAKRFTWLCHYILGIGLGLAPLGAYIAVTGHFHALPILYASMVMLWVAGFDILYALQDEAFDKSQGLYSVPGRFGKKTAKHIAIGTHMACAIALVYITSFQSTLISSLQWLHWLGAVGFIALLIWQHMLVQRYDLAKIDKAFFETNGIASVLFGTIVILDVLT